MSLVLALGLGLRICVLDWGQVSDASLRSAGYPDSLLLPGRGAAAGGEVGRIYGTYAYDEAAYTHFIPWFLRLQSLREKWRTGENTAAQTLWAAYRSAYAEGHMSLAPVAPLVMAIFTAALAEGIYGIPLRSEEDIGDWHTAFYRFGRWLSVAMMIPAFFLFLALWRRLTDSDQAGWPVLGGAAFLIQHALLTHGRFISYNVAVLTLEMGLLLGAYVLLQSPLPPRFRQAGAAVLGMLLGLGLATKLTVAPVGFCIGLALLADGMKRCRLGEKKIPSLFPVLAYGAAAALLTFFFFFPALAHPDAAYGVFTQKRMLLGLDDLETPSRAAIYAAYFTRTLPAAMGWPLYLTGWIGLLSWAWAWVWNWRWRWRKAEGNANTSVNTNAKTLPSLVAGSALLYVLLYPTNPLGLEVQRSLSVITLWLLMAGMAMDRALRFRSGPEASWLARSAPRAFRLWGLYLLLGLGFAGLSTTWHFAKERPGYRHAMSQWILRHITEGDTLAVGGRDTDHYSDISLVEMSDVPGKRNRYHWRLIANPETRPPGAWGHDYAVHASGPAMVIFRSGVKRESPWHQGLRMALGYHRWDQILNQPDFAILPPVSDPFR